MKLRTFLVSSLLVASSRVDAQHGHAGHSRPEAPPNDSAHMAIAADAAMGGHMSPAARKHMRLTPTRAGTAADSAKARAVAHELRVALAKYADTAAATADGYRMFMPNLKQQKVFHFTNYRHAALEAFRFDPVRPTSLLYERAADGRLKLVGAMYTAPRRTRVAKLDERIPLSIARWHQHVNWCIPPRGENDRWLERRDSLPLFGPESPIATRKDCDAVGGRFIPAAFGWMVHANVFAGDDLATVFGHGH